MGLRADLIKKFSTVELSEEGFTIDIERLVDYAIAVYVCDSDVTIDLDERKDTVMKELKITNQSDRAVIRFNKSATLSKIVTEILRKTSSRDFELYVSALEGAKILLDVVRRPIDDSLEDEKWLSALKSKKQGFIDAQELLDRAKAIAEKTVGATNTDVEAHVETVVFNKGQAEILAEKARDKK